MRSQATEDAKTPGETTSKKFLARWEGPVTIVISKTAIGIFITACLALIGWVVPWMMDMKAEALRGELAGEIKTTNAEVAALRNQMGTSNEGTESRTTTLDGDIGKNNRRISDNGERIAHMEGTLAGTADRLNRVHTQVTKNTEDILRSGGTPDVKERASE